MGYSFKKLLSMSFNTVLEQYDDVIQVDSARHIVNIKGSYMNDSFSDDSMVVVFYNIIGDEKPLLVIERVKAKQWRKLTFRKRVRETKNSIKGEYVVSIGKTKRGFVDIILTKRSIYDRMA